MQFPILSTVVTNERVVNPLLVDRGLPRGGCVAGSAVKPGRQVEIATSQSGEKLATEAGLGPAGSSRPLSTQWRKNATSVMMNRLEQAI